MVFSLIDGFKWLVLVMNRWVCPFIFLFGTLGNISNLIVFTRETFLKQSCSLYFLCISLNNLAIYSTGLTTRIIDDGWQLNLSLNNSGIYCKIRNYLVYTSLSISNWLYVLASFDRFYATNQSALRRQLYCSYKMAFKLIFLTTGVCILAHIHILIFYDFFFKSDLDDQLAFRCATNISSYDIFNAFFILIFYSLLPPILMSIFGILTIKNLHKSRRQINCITILTLSRTMKKRRDTNQIIKVLSLQILLLILFTIPHSCYYLYIAFTSSIQKTNLSKEYEKISLHIARILLYINYGSSFYVQIIISKTFRNEFKKLFYKFIKKFQRRN